VTRETTEPGLRNPSLPPGCSGVGAAVARVTGAGVAHPADALAAAPVVRGGEGDGADPLGMVRGPAADAVPVGDAKPADPRFAAPVVIGGVGDGADPPGRLRRPVAGAVVVGVDESANALVAAPIGGV